MSKKKFIHVSELAEGDFFKISPDGDICKMPELQMMYTCPLCGEESISHCGVGNALHLLPGLCLSLMCSKCGKVIFAATYDPDYKGWATVQNNRITDCCPEDVKYWAEMIETP